MRWASSSVLLSAFPRNLHSAFPACRRLQLAWPGQLFRIRRFSYQLYRWGQASAGTEVID